MIEQIVPQENNLEFSDSGDTSTVVEIPKEVRKINTQAYDKSVSDLIRMIEDKDIILDPDFQRNYVWDNKKASLLIESIILNVPIPVVYVSQSEDDTWTVIDGLQRLWSLKRFFDGKFKLTGLEILTELNKQDISSLNSKALRMLKNGLLRVIMITNDSNEDIKYDVFMRLNTGSVHLTEQELRNCLYKGSLNRLLKDLTSNEQWLSLLGISEPHKRMADREMILRFFSLHQNWDSKLGVITNYKGRMKNFLNDYMKQNQNVSQNIVIQHKELFDSTVNKVVAVFGENAFRTLNESADQERSINRAIMDVIMVSLSEYELDELLIKKYEIKKAFYDAIANNKTFKDSLLIATSDTKALKNRFTIWYNILSNIMMS